MIGKYKLPIGVDEFDKIRRCGFYYVDKTDMISDLLHNWGKVNLFTRPRRFGKSLNMSMLRHFFQLGCDKTLFEGLKIAEEKELCEEYMGKYPVIFISLKAVSARDYKNARAMLCAMIGYEAMKYQFLTESEKLSEDDKKLYRQLITLDESGEGTFYMSDATLTNSLWILSGLLKKHYGKDVIILIDEYDVPLDKAYQQGYYDEMVNLLRNLFIQALKSNENLHFAVLTGCMRISKESFFTGLNNLRILSVTNVQFDEYFGFTDKEVRQMLKYYGLSEHYETVKAWYDGYRFGEVNVYCPWDVINYCDELCASVSASPKSYWSNTSSNELIRTLLQKAKKTTKREIEELIAGESVRKRIRQELTYSELDTTIDNLWSVLFTTGYLTQNGNPEEDVYDLVIPNLEIRSIFVKQIREWFDEETVRDGGVLNAFCLAFKEGDAQTIEKMFQAYLMKTISIRDTNVQKNRKESFYHGILLGLLSHMEEWDVSSNAETGEGYSDILVEIENEKVGIVIEVKYAENNAMEAACNAALKQIECKKYEQKLLMDGAKKVFKYGIACYKKQCKVELGN